MVEEGHSRLAPVEVRLGRLARCLGLFRAGVLADWAVRRWEALQEVC